MNLLHIDSSPLGTQSVSRRLTSDMVSRWLAQHPDTQVTHLDLAASPPAHWSMDAAAPRLGTPEAELTSAQRRENAVTETLLQQFLQADVIVLGAPLYNFSVPSQLKAWIDRIAVAGRTFRYTAQGPEGLAGGKTVLIASTRGGRYSDSAQGQAMEHQESYLRTVLGFLGITDVRIVRAEGLAMGDEARQSALAGAELDMRRHIAQAANATPLSQAA